VLAIQVQHTSKEIEKEVLLWIRRLHSEEGRRLVQSSINRSNVTAVFNYQVVDFETKFYSKLAIDVVDFETKFDHRSFPQVGIRGSVLTLKRSSSVEVLTFVSCLMSNNSVLQTRANLVSHQGRVESVGESAGLFEILGLIARYKGTNFFLKSVD